MVRACAFLLIAGLFLPGTARAADSGLALDIPVQCEFGSECLVQQYVDHDPGPGWLDYACGRLSYNGHKGTDIRVPDLPAMHRGVPVVAAAPGIVRATRDGMADVNVREIGGDTVRGREAGNGVVIDHGNGWETQYSHLRRGSVAVRRGQRVTAGQHLGLIGMSGNAEFPHLEFSVRHDGAVIDPFVGTTAFDSCSDPRQPLWTQAALNQLGYQPTGGVIAGFATQRPQLAAAQEGQYEARRLPVTVPALVFWAQVYGTRPGDVQRIRIEGPDGDVVLDSNDQLDSAKIRWFAFGGRRQPAEGWRPGPYLGTYTLVRDGKTVVELRRAVVLGGRF